MIHDREERLPAGTFKPAPPLAGMGPGGSDVPAQDQPAFFARQGRPEAPAAPAEAPAGNDLKALFEEEPSAVPAPAPAASAAPPGADLKGLVEADMTGPLQRFAGGFNSRLAELAGVPVDAMDEALRLAGVRLSKEPINARQALRDAMQSVGIDARATDTFAGEVGDQLFDGLASLAALMTAAPLMAAKQGTSLVSYIVRTFGEMLTRNPGTAILAELGAAPGAVAGKEVIGGDLGEVIGALAGAGSAEMTRRTLAAGAKVTVKGGKALAGLVSTQPPPTGAGPSPLIDPFSDPIHTRAFAAERLKQDLATLDSEMDKAILKIAPGAAPLEQEAAVRTGLLRARRVGRRLESRLWNRVPGGAPVKPVALIREVDRIVSETSELAPGSAPEKLIADITGELTQIIRDPATKQTVRVIKTTTVDDLKQLRSRVLREARLERGSIAPNSTLLRRYAELEEVILDSIRGSMDENGMSAFDNARAFSKRYNDLFYRGPLAEVMRLRRTGAPRVPPGQTVQKLLREFEGVKQAKAASEELRQKNIMTEMDAAVRGLFQEEAQRRGPRGAAAFLKKNEKEIAPLARTLADLRISAEELKVLAQARDDAEKSAFALFAGREPQVAAERIFASTDPTADARLIVSKLQDNPEALAGFQKSLVELLLIRGSFSGRKMSGLMAQPKMSEMFLEVLSPEQFARLGKLIENAARIETGDEKMLRKLYRGGVTLTARVLGAQLGRKLAALLGGGTVQTPGFLANISKSVAEDAMRGLPPGKILAYSIVDSRWEKTLNASVPDTPTGVAKLTRRFRRTIAAMEGVRQKELRELEEEGRQEENRDFLRKVLPGFIPTEAAR